MAACQSPKGRSSRTRAAAETLAVDSAGAIALEGAVRTEDSVEVGVGKEGCAEEDSASNLQIVAVAAAPLLV